MGTTPVGGKKMRFLPYSFTQYILLVSTNLWSFVKGLLHSAAFKLFEQNLLFVRLLSQLFNSCTLCCFITGKTLFLVVGVVSHNILTAYGESVSTLIVLYIRNALNVFVRLRIKIFVFLKIIYILHTLYICLNYDICYSFESCLRVKNMMPSMFIKCRLCQLKYRNAGREVDGCREGGGGNRFRELAAVPHVSSDRVLLSNGATSLVISHVFYHLAVKDTHYTPYISTFVKMFTEFPYNKKSISLFQAIKFLKMSVSYRAGEEEVDFLTVSCRFVTHKFFSIEKIRGIRAPLENLVRS